MYASYVRQITSYCLPRKFRLVVMVICVAGTGFLLTLTACSQPQPQPKPKERVSTIDEHGLHAIDNQRLRNLMEQLKAIQVANIADDLKTGSIDEQRIEEVSEIAGRLAGDARLIPQVYRNLELNDESQRVFDNLAAQMQEECRQLGNLARRHQTQAMQAKVNDIISTCNSCHASFRGPSVALAPQVETPLRVGL